ncbi:histone-like nucleoid-structuring protein Lsr2 [Streptomyces sviceus]|uniref:histone-like nucleoid-structuring protein Lsr2 n=1 Tax=Streptomyces sviceus TaxID=285530 RepID=UPI00331E93F6
MATKTVKVDDLDNKTEGAEEVTFGLNGDFYKLDLAAANTKKLTDALAPFVEAATPITAREATRRNGNGNGAVPADMDPAKVRAWAQANGYDIGEKGRVPENIQEAYRKANEKQPAGTQA